MHFYGIVALPCVIVLLVFGVCKFATHGIPSPPESIKGKPAKKSPLKADVGPYGYVLVILTLLAVVAFVVPRCVKFCEDWELEERQDEARSRRFFEQFAR